MKNVYIIQNSQLSFDMDMSKIYSPDKYSLFLIINRFGQEKLKLRNQEHYFVKIWLTDNFTFDHLKEIISKNQINFNSPIQIVTNAEEAVEVCGDLRVQFNIDAQNYDRLKNKILMKKLLNKHGLLTPKHIMFDYNTYIKNPAEYISYITKILTFPLIVKPINAMACTGVEKINSITELNQWCEKINSNDYTYEIDEFIEGKVYNCDSYIKNNQILFTQVSECSNSCYDFLCGITKGTIALPRNDPIYSFFCEYTNQVHEAIKIPSAGVTHLEVILTKDKKLYFIEIAYRSPGILIPAMYKKFLNISTIESHILLQIDDDYDLSIDYGPFCAWIAFPTRHGKLIKTFTPNITSEYQLEWQCKIGDIMSNPTKGRDYAGKMLLWNDDYQKLKNDFEYLNTYKFYDIKNCNLVES